MYTVSNTCLCEGPRKETNERAILFMKISTVAMLLTANLTVSCCIRKLRKKTPFFKYLSLKLK